ncbi:MAG: acyl--CoA ligase, partial [Planctomycetes bacterium]|nr:acyl--CoA ligase [Planctomycetota bacterium]
MRVHDYFDFHAQQSPDSEFAVGTDRRITYGEAQRESNRIAHALIAAGLHPGDRIALLLKNSIDAVLIYYGAFKAGIVPTPVNHRLTQAEWVRIADDMEAKLLISDAAFAADVDSLRCHLRSVRSYIARVAEPLAG